MLSLPLKRNEQRERTSHGTPATGSCLNPHPFGRLVRPPPWRSASCRELAPVDRLTLIANASTRRLWLYGLATHPEALASPPEPAEPMVLSRANDGPASREGMQRKGGGALMQGGKTLMQRNRKDGHGRMTGCFGHSSSKDEDVF
jgi:hypothetical protein